MAKVNARLPEEYLLRLSRLGEKTDEIAERALKAGGEVVLEKMRGNLRSVIGRGTKEQSRATGELLGSLGVSPADVDYKGVHNVKIGFAEPRREQIAAKGKRSYKERTNAMIANVLEYGKSGQAPRPFLQPAKSASKKPCEEAMKAAFEQELGSI